MTLPDNLQRHPRLGQWLDVARDGRVRAWSGKVELGQGIAHALRIIVAGELQLQLDEVVMARTTTVRSPDEAVTSGSLSVQHSGTALRLAAAQLREACRIRYAQRQGVDAAQVQLENGTFCLQGVAAPARYAQLVDAAMLAQPIAAAPAQAQPLPVADAGHALAEAPRPDVADKVFGRFEYIQDLALPGLCFGQVFRPSTLQAQLDGQAALRLEDAVRRIEGVLSVVRDGLLIGVLTEAESTLRLAARRVAQASPWSGTVQVPAAEGLAGWLKAQPLDTSVIMDRQPATPAAATRLFSAEFQRPYLQHASIGLCCALAQWHEGTLQVWSHSQGIFNLRRDLALAFGLPPGAVQVCHAEGAGCYGHNGADDVAFDAAWLGRHAGGRPVRVQWTRQEEMAQSPLGAAMTVAVTAGIDDSGRLVAWRQQVWSQGHGTRPGRDSTPALLGAWQTAQPFPITMAVNAPQAAGGGSERNAVPPYAIDSVQVQNHRVLAMPVRVSALRSLGAHLNVLAAESLIDDIAASLGRDPLAYRLAHLEDERGCAVLREAARLAGWGEPAATPREEGAGRGIGFARYKNTGAWCAVIADLVVTDRVQLRQLFIAADLGQVVHPDGARNQIEGGAIQAASWTLCESAQFGPQGVSSRDWGSYPIFRFSDVPQVQVSLMPGAGRPSLGAGECSCGPAAAAIGNAIHDALGVRMRALPFDAGRLLKTAFES